MSNVKDQFTPVLKRIDTANKRIEKVHNTYKQRIADTIEKLEAEYDEKLEAAELELSEAKKALAELTSEVAV